MGILPTAVLSVCLSVIAQFFLKRGMSSATIRSGLGDGLSLQIILKILFEGWIATGFLLYLIGAIVWLQVLARWEVSKAYPIVGFGFVLSAAIGLALGEAVTTTRLIGVALICVGVYVVSRT